MEGNTDIKITCDSKRFADVACQTDKQMGNYKRTIDMRRDSTGWLPFILFAILAIVVTISICLG